MVSNYDAPNTAAQERGTEMDWAVAAFPLLAFIRPDAAASSDTKAMQQDLGAVADIGLRSMAFVEFAETTGGGLAQAVQNVPAYENTFDVSAPAANAPDFKITA